MQILDEPKFSVKRTHKRPWLWLGLAYLYIFLYWGLIAYLLPSAAILEYGASDWPLLVFALVFLVPIWVVGILWHQATLDSAWDSLRRLSGVILICIAALALTYFAFDFPRFLFIKLYQFSGSPFWAFVLGLSFSYCFIPTLLWLLPRNERLEEYSN